MSAMFWFGREKNSSASETAAPGPTWNGLRISALARGAMALDKKECLDSADNAASFIMDRLYDGMRKILLRRYREGVTGIDGMLDD